MKNIPKNERSCKHIIVMALATPFGVFTAHGEMSGVVADKPSDKRVPQFPYESIIYLPNYNKYWAELSDEENEYLSHRRVALEKIKDILQELSK
jgi:XTP/dITP diphosphohydrolase